MEGYLSNGKEIAIPKDAPKNLMEKGGVFVTLETYPGHELRGCIGYPEPIMPLIEATIKSGISAATRDPRFSKVTREEMDNIIVEVSILTIPERIRVERARDYLKEIIVGEHGVIIEQGFYKGLLLPQVPVDEDWDAEQFLSYTCMKAGLPPDCWYDENTKVYRFSGKVFTEIKPRGEVIEKKLKRC
jgi:hypothetical protein